MDLAMNDDVSKQPFVGRMEQFNALDRELDRIRNNNSHQRGKAIFMSGRRRIGKSRLVDEFCRRSGLPYVFFTASRQGDNEVELFTQDVAESTLAGREVFEGSRPQTWEAALRLLATVLDDDTPTIVVIDEFPYLVETDQTIEATFQKNWDRRLSAKPILLILIGSDLAMMEALNTHGRALFQRGIDIIVPPLSPTETAKFVGSASPADSFDAHILTGGLPLICDEWPRGNSLWQYLEDALRHPTSALIVSAERVLRAEFPSDTHAYNVLGEIGHGEVTFSKIARAGGGSNAASLNRSLDILTRKRIVSREVPLSTQPSKEARYRVTDSYLRFWLRFIGPHMPEIERGRAELVLARIKRDWTTWRGKAVEPLMREALLRMPSIGDAATPAAIGGFWTRSNNPEVDLVGADRSPIADHIAFVGSIKWLENNPIEQADINQLIANAPKIPGVDHSTRLVAVSRTSVPARSVLRKTLTVIEPKDLLKAWK